MIICFSANASILAGIALFGIGIVTARRADGLTQLPYAAIPLAFGMQQLVEGCLWIILPAQFPTTGTVASLYLFLSHVLWPIQASSIQQMSRALKTAGVGSARVKAKAYWTPGKTGLD
tara:strand:- start:1464 stop:1817 length:354 start_codon:yes stop_codon:yes gene_type:complete